MQASPIHSVADLIEHLGGPKAAGDALGTTPQNVVNWRAAKRIPARFHILHRARLSARGIQAPESLWGFVQEAAE